MFKLNQDKLNEFRILTRKVYFTESQQKLVDQFAKVISPTFFEVEPQAVKIILTLAVKEWEKENQKPVSDFRFMHVNERIKAFNEIQEFFIEKLNEALINKIPETKKETWKSLAVMAYKTYLERSGYNISYTSA